LRPAVVTDHVRFPVLDVFSKIAEQKIREAQERGDFDNLPGRGRKLEYPDDSRVPQELRMAYKILKNAGFTPPEIQLKNEILQIEDMLEGIDDEQEKYRQIKKLNYLVMKLNSMRPRPVTFEEQQRYYSAVVSRITVPESKK
jgi:hypothetical protein